MPVTLTPQQQAAVENRGGSLLVSAAAGSGKTRVLVDRLFRYITEERCNVNDFLIITYTRAAAAELRGKIAAELSRRVGENPLDTHLRRQLLRVYQADIKTVDAFCAALLRENTHRLFWTTAKPPSSAAGFWTGPSPGFTRTSPPAAGSWRTPWGPAGTIPPWRRWCWSSTTSSRATPPRRTGFSGAGPPGSPPPPALTPPPTPRPS